MYEHGYTPICFSPRYCLPATEMCYSLRCSATAKAARRVIAQHKLILSGTPVQNRVDELWAIFDFLMPNFLGDSSYFSKEYARPIAKSHSPEASAASIATGMQKLKELHQQVLPFVLRRDKAVVLKELPPKVISKMFASMSEVQASLYHRACQRKDTQESLKALESMLTLSDGEPGNMLAKTEGDNVLKSLFILRLLCTHPALLLDERQRSLSSHQQLMTVEASGKFVALVELFRLCGLYSDALYCADNDTTLYYCDDELPYEASGTHAADDGLYSSTALRSSPILSSPIHTATTTVSKCLLFAQFKDSLDLVEEIVLKTLIPTLKYLRLDGNVPGAKRSEVADRFNTDPSVRLLLLTTRVGGLGLNLTGT
jgi:TATA-binding protein-associated factor